MYHLIPLHPAAKDAMTGETMPADGVKREVLLPPDHYAERTGDIKITKLDDEAAPTGGGATGTALASTPKADKKAEK